LPHPINYLLGKWVHLCFLFCSCSIDF
jgi:hypothetical protein